MKTKLGISPEIRNKVKLDAIYHSHITHIISLSACPIFCISNPSLKNVS